MTCQEKLGGIFKWPILNEVREKNREKFGYSTREEKPEVSVKYVPNPLRDPPLPSYIPPRFFPFFRF